MTMYEDPFYGCRNVVVDVDHGRYAVDQPKSRFGILANEGKLQDNLKKACTDGQYSLQAFKTLADVKSLFETYHAYLVDCRAIIEESVDSNRRRVSARKIVKPPTQPETPFPHVVLVDLPGADSLVRYCETVRDIKKLGRAGQACCFVAVVPANVYRHRLVQTVMAHGFHSVLKYDSDWLCELMKLDMGCARDRFAIEEAQVAFDMVYHCPVSCEITTCEARMQYVNDEFEHMFGFSHEAVKGETPKSIMRSHANEDAANHFFSIDKKLENCQVYHGTYFAKNAKSYDFPVDTYLCVHPRLDSPPQHMAMKSPVFVQALQRVAIDDLVTSSTSLLSAIRSNTITMDELRHALERNITALAQQQSTTPTATTKAATSTTDPNHADELRGSECAGKEGTETDPLPQTHLISSSTSEDDDVALHLQRLVQAQTFASELVHRLKEKSGVQKMITNRTEEILGLIEEDKSTFRPRSCVSSLAVDRPEFVNNYVSCDPTYPKKVIPCSESDLFSTGGLLEKGGRTWAEFDEDVEKLPSEGQATLVAHRQWNCNLLSLEKLKPLGIMYGPLFFTGMTIFRHFNVCETLNIDAVTLSCWLNLMEANYRPDVAYHTSTHAADVLQAAAFFVGKEKMRSKLSPLDIACVLIAAITHDLGHAGVSNAFLTATDNPLASLYMDSSVMEHYHASLAWELSVKYSKCNIYKGIENQKMKYGSDNRMTNVRTVMQMRIRQLILATDMSFNDIILKRFSSITNIDAALKPSPANEKEEVSVILARLNACELLLSMVIKAADICNPARPVEIGKPWSFRVAEEFVIQSDLEDELSVSSVLPVFTRQKFNLPSSQAMFIQYIVEPLYQSLGTFLPLNDILELLKTNKEYWTGEDPEQYPPAAKREVVWDPYVFNLREFLRGALWQDYPASPKASGLTVLQSVCSTGSLAASDAAASSRDVAACVDSSGTAPATGLDAVDTVPATSLAVSAAAQSLHVAAVSSAECSDSSPTGHSDSIGIGDNVPAPGTAQD